MKIFLSVAFDGLGRLFAQSITCLVLRYLFSMSTLILWNLYTENMEVLSTLKGINSVFDTKYLLYIWFYNIWCIGQQNLHFY